MGFKLKTQTIFPADVVAQSPLTVIKVGRKYTFGVDASQGALGPTGAGYGGTSTTSLAIGTGSKTFTTQSGYAYQAGNYIRASSAADGTNYMEGTITSYTNIGGGLATLILNVSKVGGSGTKTDWAFSLAGTPGANGAGSGDMLAAQNLADVSNKKTALDNISVHGADIASAATINLETSTGDLVDVTGTTTITAITLNDGHERTVRFTGVLTLTNGASLVLPGAANITTAAGDFAVFRGYAAGVVRCVSYDRASGMTAGVAAFLGAPSSSNLAAALTDETGSGPNVFATQPILAQPLIQGRTPTTGAATFVNGSPTITVTGHGLTALAPVFFATTGTLPTNFTAAVPPAAGTVSANTYLSNPTLYYVIGSSIAANTFQVATSIANAIAGTAVTAGSAGSGTHTMFANAMVPTGYIGERIWNVVPIASSVAAVSGSAGQVWNTISLSAGIWKIGGNTGVIKQGAGTPVFSHMHCGLVYGFTTIPTSPYNSSTAAHITSNDPNGWMFTNNPEQIFLTGTTTINAVATTDFAPTTANTAGFYGETWAERVA
jgi:hypothetical protein